MSLIAKLFLSVFIFAVIVGFIASCGSPEEPGETEEATEEAEELDPLENKGVGPIDHVSLDEELDPEMIDKGRTVFESKCEACHRYEERRVGPPIKDVTERRTPEWIMNMILNPSGMLREDPIARELLQEYMTEMTYQNVSEEEARAILEYFRHVDREGEM